MELDRPIVGLGNAVVDQAVNQLGDIGQSLHAEKLQGRNTGGVRVCNGADVRRAQGGGFDADKETADGEQERGDNVARRAIEDEAKDAVEW